MEYYRQGFHFEFNSILNEIVSSLEDNHVASIFRKRENYNENIAKIFDALAADSLNKFLILKNKENYSLQSTELTKSVVDLLKKSEEIVRLNEYTWLIKGFYEIAQGNFFYVQLFNINLLNR